MQYSTIFDDLDPFNKPTTKKLNKQLNKLQYMKNQ